MSLNVFIVFTLSNVYLHQYPLEEAGKACMSDVANTVAAIFISIRLPREHVMNPTNQRLQRR